MGRNLWERWIAWRHEKRTDLSSGQIEVIPKLSLNRSDGWLALELVLENRSDLTVWTEDATIVLADLDANSQTRIPPGQVVHKIRQNIGANGCSESGATYSSKLALLKWLRFHR
jgi:hypothetical protein